MRKNITEVLNFLEIYEDRHRRFIITSLLNEFSLEDLSNTLSYSDKDNSVVLKGHIDRIILLMSDFSIDIDIKISDVEVDINSESFVCA